MGDGIQGIPDEARIINTLTDRYEKIGKLARPVANSSMPIKVVLAIMLSQLLSVDESEQFVSLKLMMHMVCTLTDACIVGRRY